MGTKITKELLNKKGSIELKVQNLKFVLDEYHYTLLGLYRLLSEKNLEPINYGIVENDYEYVKGLVTKLEDDIQRILSDGNKDVLDILNKSLDLHILDKMKQIEYMDKIVAMVGGSN